MHVQVSIFHADLFVILPYCVILIIIRNDSTVFDNVFTDNEGDVICKGSPIIQIGIIEAVSSSKDPSVQH